MNVSEREQDSFDFSSVTLSLLSDGGGKTIDNFRDLDDGSKVLVEVNTVGKFAKKSLDMDENPSQDATTRGTP